MSTKLNLASKPFSNRLVPWTVTTVVVVVSLGALIFIVRATGQANVTVYAVQRDISALREQEQALRKQAEAVKNSLSPEQVQTLSAAHELVDRKRFSWSRLFADLETALPGNVRVTRISVRDVAARGDQMLAELDLSLVAKTSPTITTMISDMDRAGIFQAELRTQNLQKGRGETGTEFELYVVYRPRAGTPVSEGESSSVALVEPSATGSGNQDEPRVRE